MKRYITIGLIIFYTNIFISNCAIGQTISYKQIIDNKIQYCFDSTQWNIHNDTNFHYCSFFKSYNKLEIKNIKKIVKVLNNLYKDSYHSISKTPKWFRKYIGKIEQDGANRFIYTVQNNNIRLYIICNKASEVTSLDFQVNLLDAFICNKKSGIYATEHTDYVFLRELNIDLPILYWECPVVTPRFGWE